jgi:hypothetical protein
MSDSCWGGSAGAKRPKVGVVEVVAASKTPKIATEHNTQKTECSCEASPEGGTMTQLPTVWQRLVSADGKTCPRCDATSQHLQSAAAKLKEVLKPLNVEPILELREIGESSFRSNPTESNRIWIAGKPLEEWLGASIGSSSCCSVCGDTPC